MNIRLLVALTLVCLPLLGCQSDPALDLLESELRWMEDQIYNLEGEYELQRARLESCRRENKALKKELSGSGDAGPGPSLSLPSGGAGIPGPPTIELPAASDAPPSTPEGGPDLEDSDPPPDDGAGVRNSRVSRIVLNQRLTGGYDINGRTGDEGVQLVIEPQNADGQYVSQAGKISVVVLDPQLSGPAARVAHWNFDAAEAKLLLGKTLFARGIHLELPWPGHPPTSSHLQLYVRYTTQDGQKLEVNQTIQVDPPGQLLSDRWTPAAHPGPVDRRDTRVVRPVSSQLVLMPAKKTSKTKRTEASPKQPPKPRLPQWSPDR